MSNTKNPNVCIVGFGYVGCVLGAVLAERGLDITGIEPDRRIREAVVPVDGQPAIRRVLPLVVATDHRLNDGEQSGGFMTTLTTFLSEPIRMLGQL